MRKFLKVMLTVFIMSGLVFSILNFVSIKTEAWNPNPLERGSWVIVNGGWECGGDGNECDLGDFEQH